MKIIPIEKSKFKKADLDFILILEENEIFEKAIKGIREKVGLPDTGFKTEHEENGKIKIVNFHSDTTTIINKASGLLNEPIKDLLHAFSLPTSWWGTFFSIIMLNLATPPMRDQDWYKSVEIKYIGGLSSIISRMQGKIEHPNQVEPHIEINVREGMSFTKLIDSLNNQKATIEKYLKYLNKVPATNHLKDIQIKKEILNLEKEDKSDLEIADWLVEKYGNDLPFDPDHNTINHYKNRFKKLIKEQPSNKYYLYYLGKYIKDN